MFLAKYDASGNLLWARAATGSFAVEGNEVDADSSGNVFVAGDFGHHNFGGNATFGGTTLSSLGGTDAFLAKYDANGTFLWVRRLGGGQTQAARGVAADSLGNVLVSGQFEGTVDFGGTSLTSTGSFDHFTAKYSPTGALLWVRKGGGTGSDQGEGVDVDGTNNVVVTGCITGSANFDSIPLNCGGQTDIAVAKYDPNGNILWAQCAGGAQFEFSLGVGSNSIGETFVTGLFQSTVSFGSSVLTSVGSQDVFVAKFDAVGNPVWAKQAGSDTAGDERGWGVAANSTGRVFVAGSIVGDAVFDEIVLSSAGERDMFVAALDPPNAAPEAECNDVTESAGSNCTAGASIDDGSFDPDGDPVTLDQAPPGPYSLGDNLVTLTVTDGSGETDFCEGTVTVVDNSSPLPDDFLLPDVTGQCSAEVSVAPTATDSCAGTVVGTTSDPLTYSEQGTFFVNWTFDDGNGNSSTQTQTVIVQQTPCGKKGQKVFLCHAPPGNPSNQQTICISPSAVDAYLANHPGDSCGPCVAP